MPELKGHREEPPSDPWLLQMLGIGWLATSLLHAVLHASADRLAGTGGALHLQNLVPQCQLVRAMPEGFCSLSCDTYLLMRQPPGRGWHTGSLNEEGW